MKNKKGFTLVELLAVIVILALIMSIAVISIGGVLDKAKADTFKETGASIIDGVKKQLLINNRLDEGYYYVYSTILEKGGQTSPFGGGIAYYTEACNGSNEEKIGTMVCKTTSKTCSDSAKVFVHIASDKTASICLTAGSGKKYIKDVAGTGTVAGTEANLLGTDNTMIITP